MGLKTDKNGFLLDKKGNIYKSANIILSDMRTDNNPYPLNHSNATTSNVTLDTPISPTSSQGSITPKNRSPIKIDNP